MYREQIHLPGTLMLWVILFSLQNSRDVQCICSAFARRISIFVDRTKYLHFSRIICFEQPNTECKISNQNLRHISMLPEETNDAQIRKKRVRKRIHCNRKKENMSEEYYIIKDTFQNLQHSILFWKPNKTPHLSLKKLIVKVWQYLPK